MHKVLYNFFTCSCSAEVWFSKLQCHWGWCCQCHIGSSTSFWRLWLWLHCDSPVHEWVGYWWVCLYCSNCQGLVISDITLTSQWSFPFLSQQLAMTIHLVLTLWASLLVNCMPPWWCLPWTTTLQSYQRTSWLQLPPLTNQVLLRLSHPTQHSSLLRIMIQVLYILSMKCVGWATYVCMHTCMYVIFVHVMYICTYSIYAYVIVIELHIAASEVEVEVLHVCSINSSVWLASMRSCCANGVGV